MICFAYYIQDRFEYDKWQWNLTVAMNIMERNIRNMNDAFNNLIQINKTVSFKPKMKETEFLLTKQKQSWLK